MPGAVFAHQQRVVHLLNARLADDGPRRQRAVADLRFAGFTDIAEQMRRHLVCGIVPRRHLVHLHVGQLGIEPARQHRGHLPERCILDDDDGLIARVAAMAGHEILDVALVKARHLRQHLDRVIEVLAVLAQHQLT